MWSDIQQALQCDTLKIRPVSGGCTGQTFQVFANDKTVFVKFTEQPHAARCEAHGLQACAQATGVNLPGIVAYDDQWLILAYLDPAPKAEDFFAQLATQLVHLHRVQHSQYGFDEDNYCGVSPQCNTWCGEWAHFFYEHRLVFQLKLAEQNGHATTELRRAVGKLENKLESILLGSTEPPRLLHGDLWFGNYHAGPDGQPYLIDPAVYYGHREADLALTRLFGGFDESFYQTYQALMPLPEGYATRERLYQLYHILKHLNILGAEYYPQAMSLLGYYV